MRNRGETPALSNIRIIDFRAMSLLADSGAFFPKAYLNKPALAVRSMPTQTKRALHQVATQPQCALLENQIAPKAIGIAAIAITLDT